MHFFKSLLSLEIAAISTKLLPTVHNGLFKYYFMHTQNNNTQATEKSHRDKMNFFYIFNERPSFLDICNNTQTHKANKIGSPK